MLGLTEIIAGIGWLQRPLHGKTGIFSCVVVIFYLDQFESFEGIFKLYSSFFTLFMAVVVCMVHVSPGH